MSRFGFSKRSGSRFSDIHLDTLCFKFTHLSRALVPLQRYLCRVGKPLAALPLSLKKRDSLTPPRREGWTPPPPRLTMTPPLARAADSEVRRSQNLEYIFAKSFFIFLKINTDFAIFSSNSLVFGFTKLYTKFRKYTENLQIYKVYMFTN